jgi:hypothetical protein
MVRDFVQNMRTKAEEAISSSEVGPDVLRSNLESMALYISLSFPGASLIIPHRKFNGVFYNGLLQFESFAGGRKIKWKN